MFEQDPIRYRARLVDENREPVSDMLEVEFVYPGDGQLIVPVDPTTIVFRPISYSPARYLEIWQMPEYGGELRAMFTIPEWVQVV